MKLSKWIDGKKFKPAHVGVYQVKINKRVRFQHWNGSYWGATMGNVINAYSYWYIEGVYQNRKFRGLAEKP